jgi:hypothetical protein
MAKKETLDNLVRVKTALADKYARRALTVRSKPAKASALRQSRKHRQQAANAARGKTG